MQMSQIQEQPTDRDNLSRNKKTSYVILKDAVIAFEKADIEGALLSQFMQNNVTLESALVNYNQNVSQFKKLQENHETFLKNNVYEKMENNKSTPSQSDVELYLNKESLRLAKEKDYLINLAMDLKKEHRLTLLATDKTNNPQISSTVKVEQSTNINPDKKSQLETNKSFHSDSLTATLLGSNTNVPIDSNTTAQREWGESVPLISFKTSQPEFMQLGSVNLPKQGAIYFLSEDQIKDLIANLQKGKDIDEIILAYSNDEKIFSSSLDLKNIVETQVFKKPEGLLSNVVLLDSEKNLPSENLQNIPHKTEYLTPSIVQDISVAPISSSELLEKILHHQIIHQKSNLQNLSKNFDVELRDVSNEKDLFYSNPSVLLSKKQLDKDHSVVSQLSDQPFKSEYFESYSLDQYHEDHNSELGLDGEETFNYGWHERVNYTNEFVKESNSNEKSKNFDGLKNASMDKLRIDMGQQAANIGKCYKNAVCRNTKENLARHDKVRDLFMKELHEHRLDESFNSLSFADRQNMKSRVNEQLVRSGFRLPTRNFNSERYKNLQKLLNFEYQDKQNPTSNDSTQINLQLELPAKKP